MLLNLLYNKLNETVLSIVYCLIRLYCQYWFIRPSILRILCHEGSIDIVVVTYGMITQYSQYGLMKQYL